jgi:hypothetical protein
MASARKMVFGSSTTVISHAATLASGANTYSGLSGCTMTQLDNSLLYPHAKAVLNITDTFSAAPTAGTSVDLYMTHDDVDGTTDETPLPGATDILYNATYVGSFILDNQDVATVKAIIISLHGVQKAQFYILNNSGVTISYASTAITVKITPFSYEPT